MKIKKWWNEKGRYSVEAALTKAKNWWNEKGRYSVEAAMTRTKNWWNEKGRYSVEAALTKIKNWWNEKGRYSVEAALTKTKNWWNENGRYSVEAFLQMLGNTCWRGLKALCKGTISWGAIIACILIAFMGNQGMLDKWPAVNWLAQCELRLLDWLIGLIQNLLQWCVEQCDYMPDEFVEWVKYIFALS